MHRVIVAKNHPDYELIVNSNPYDYRYNSKLSCIEVNTETFCFLTLRYRMNKVACTYTDMPTYAIISGKEYTYE